MTISESFSLEDHDFFMRSYPQLQADELKMHKILDNLPTAIAVTTLGFNPETIFVNKQFVRTFGYTLEDIPTVGEWALHAYPDTHYRESVTKWWTAALAQAIPQQTSIESKEFHITCKNGAVRHVMISTTILEDLLLISFLDISARKQSEESLHRCMLYTRRLIEANIDPMLTISADGKITDINQATEQIVGISRKQIIGNNFSDYFTEPEKAHEGCQQALSQGKIKDYPLTVRHVSGQTISVLYNASLYYDEMEKSQGIFAVIRDITERQNFQAELEHQARTDYLTGLFNRRYFMERGEQELARARRYGHSLSILMLDVDGFKKVNDTYGHQIGDLFLQKIGEILLGASRGTDISVRWGGEEFVILLTDAKQEDAIGAAERIRRLVAETPIRLNISTLLYVTLSIGVATLNYRDATLDKLINRADEALYQAKATGRNRVCIAKEGSTRNPA